MNKKYGWLVVGVVIVLIGMGIHLSQKDEMGPEGKQTIKIGYIAPLTGNVAFLGEGVKKAAELAIEEINKEHAKYRYEVIFEDDAFSPAKTATAANKLINVDKVDVIVTVASAAGGVANPIAEKAGVIHFGIASDPLIAKGEYNFINWTPPAEEVKTFIEEAEKRGIKRIAVFGQQISGITAVIDELKHQVEGTSLQIVSEDISNFGDKDFRTAIQKAKASNPDYLLLVMFSPELEIMTKQIREVGIQIPITAIESFELTNEPTLFEGLWYVNAADPTDEFVSKFKTKYGTSPSIATPNAYDIVGLIAAAGEKFDGKTKPASNELVSELVKIKGYDGAMGNNLNIGQDHIVVSKAVVRMIKDGNPVTISK
jgi:branched-chain amino acid transport system substrate-binding protein